MDESIFPPAMQELRRRNREQYARDYTQMSFEEILNEALHDNDPVTAQLIQAVHAINNI